MFKKVLFAVLVLVVAAAWYGRASAALPKKHEPIPEVSTQPDDLVQPGVDSKKSNKPRFTIVRKAPAGPEGKTQLVQIVGFADNGNGTGTMTIDACGTILVLTAKNLDIQQGPDDMVAALKTEIDYACY